MRHRAIFIDNRRWMGQLRIIIPAYDDPLRDASLTDEEFFQFAVAETLRKDGLPTDTPFFEMDELDAPSDRTFRNAWEAPQGTIQVNMPKARTIHMEAIRVVRNAELAAKDITFMRAVESGDTDAQTTIATEKQVLRDIPQTFDLTTDNDTPEELKAKWPTELPARE